MYPFEWRRKWQPTPVFLPGESHEQRSLVGYSPWGLKESDMTEVAEQAGRSFWMVIASAGMPRNGITGSQNRSVWFVRSLCTALRSCCIRLHSHQQGKRVSLSPRPRWLLLLVDFLAMDILTSMRRCLFVILICISLKISDVDHLFLCLFAICMPSLENCLLGPLPIFWLNGYFVCLFVFWILSFQRNGIIGKTGEDIREL